LKQNIDASYGFFSVDSACYSSVFERKFLIISYHYKMWTRLAAGHVWSRARKEQSTSSWLPTAEDTI